MRTIPQFAESKKRFVEFKIYLSELEYQQYFGMTQILDLFDM
jgi:hypothetical protein